MADDATRSIEGGPAQPVFIVNTALPSSTPAGTQSVKLVNGAGTETGTASTPIRNDPVGTTSQPVIGPAAVGAAPGNFPVPIGGITDAGLLQRYQVAASSATELTVQTGIMPAAALLWDPGGVAYVRERINYEEVIFPSAARTVAQLSPTLYNYNGRGLVLIINVTVRTAASAITPVIYGKCVSTGTYRTILLGSAISSVSTTVLRVYPGLTAVANSVANDILDGTWAVQIDVANADSITYSVVAKVQM